MIFNKIGGGSEKVTLDGKTVTKRYNFITSEKIKKDLQAMPYSCGGVAMIACSDHKRNTFHAFGHISGPALFHCSWDANSRKWTQHGEEKGFLDNAYFARLTYWKENINFLFGSTYYGKRTHRKWNGSGWTSVSSPPINVYDSPLTSSNDTIYACDMDGYTSYKYSNSWSQIARLPYSAQKGKFEYYNGKLHLIGGTDGANKHYILNGQSWTMLPNLPFNTTDPNLHFIYNNCIYVESNNAQLWKYDGANWTLDANLIGAGANTSGDILNGNMHFVTGGNEHYTLKQTYEVI